MASYTDLRQLFSNDALKNKVDIAIVISANGLLAGAPTINDQKWAASVFSNPRGESTKAMMAMIAENSGLTIEQIEGAADAAIQIKVDSVVATLVAAFAG